MYCLKTCLVHTWDIMLLTSLFCYSLPLCWLGDGVSANPQEQYRRTTWNQLESPPPTYTLPLTAYIQGNREAGSKPWNIHPHNHTLIFSLIFVGCFSFSNILTRVFGSPTTDQTKKRIFITTLAKGDSILCPSHYSWLTWKITLSIIHPTHYL